MGFAKTCNKSWLALGIYIGVYMVLQGLRMCKDALLIRASTTEISPVPKSLLIVRIEISISIALGSSGTWAMLPPGKIT